MFAPPIVGFANALSAGWGNAGGGVSMLVMPALTTGIAATGVPAVIAWRWAFLLPGALQLLLGVMVMAWGDDTPDGNLVLLSRCAAVFF